MTRPWERALDEHVHLIRWLETPIARDYTKTVSPDEGITDADGLRFALNQAETFWVSFDMYKLTLHVADKLHEKVLRDTVPPARDGFVLLDRPAGLSMEENLRFAEAGRTLESEERLKVGEEMRKIFQAFSWHIVPQGVHARAYAFIGVTDGGSRGWRVIFPSAGSKQFPCHLAPTGMCGNYDIDQTSPDPLFTFLLAFWLLCNQRLVRTATNPVERHARRRAERINLNLEDGIKVVTLRREEPRPKAAAADQSVEVQWSHRWIVSEHERNQWYPSLGMHLPITIEAYEKGPEGAPLVIKDTVYKVDR